MDPDLSTPPNHKTHHLKRDGLNPGHPVVSPSALLELADWYFNACQGGRPCSETGTGFFCAESGDVGEDDRARPAVGCDSGLGSRADASDAEPDCGAANAITSARRQGGGS